MPVRSDRFAATDGPVETLDADVLVVGGGAAGTWAAIAAARAGRSVILADKGFTGTSGVAAAVGSGGRYLEPETDADAREAALAGREALGGYLADRRWIDRVHDEAAVTGASRQDPDDMRRQRMRAERLGVRILDHSPVLELLVDAEGTVAGARGLRRQAGYPAYEVRAGAVVLATGACGFLAGAPGSDVNTGDGALFAAEVGADLSGMEFSSAYSVAPEFSSITKTAFYSWARFYRADGSLIQGAGSSHGRSLLAKALLKEPVFARLDRADAPLRNALRVSQPSFFQPFEQQGIDPFTERFPVTLGLGGAVRSAGGVRVDDDDCSTGVPGLYVAGDVASRELISGGFAARTSDNTAWAIASGTWAGTAAASFADRLGAGRVARRLRPTGGAGLRPTGIAGAVDAHRDVLAAVQAEILPYDQNVLRHSGWLAPALAELDAIWTQVRGGLAGAGANALRSREAAAMAAHGRWIYAAALARTESRGPHKRSDYPSMDPAQHHRISTGGLDAVWTKAGPKLAGGPYPSGMPSLVTTAA